MQNAQLTRTRNYNDEEQHYDPQPPSNAPEWTCTDKPVQNLAYDTDVMGDNDVDVTDEHNMDYEDYNSIIDNYYGINDDEGGETSTIGMIRGALDKGKTKENVGRRYTYFRYILIFSDIYLFYLFILLVIFRYRLSFSKQK